MMKRPKASWALRSLPEAAAVVATAPSLRTAAKQLGVSPSTLSRATRDGRLPSPRRTTPKSGAERPVASDPATQTFLGWVMATYGLTVAERELARLAQAALDLAHDLQQPSAVRLQAGARFQSLLKDLQLPPQNDEESHGETAPGVFPRQVG